eukprot:6415017-Prymnesium_polylepis.1
MLATSNQLLQSALQRLDELAAQLEEERTARRALEERVASLESAGAAGASGTKGGVATPATSTAGSTAASAASTT